MLPLWGNNNNNNNKMWSHVLTQTIGFVAVVCLWIAPHCLMKIYIY